MLSGFGLLKKVKFNTRGSKWGPRFQTEGEPLVASANGETLWEIVGGHQPCGEYHFGRSHGRLGYIWFTPKNRSKMPDLDRLHVPASLLHRHVSQPQHLLFNIFAPLTPPKSIKSTREPPVHLDPQFF